MSYFDKASKSGEQAPVYAIKFELYENGISRALVLDYNDFAISGELTSLECATPSPANRRRWRPDRVVVHSNIRIRFGGLILRMLESRTASKYKC